MILKRAFIKNFRSIKELEMNFSLLTVIVGENDIGKTTILKAIYKILRMNESPHRVQFNEEDFYIDRNTNERSNEIVIELTFTDLDKIEKDAFFWAGIDLEKEEITIRLDARWEEQNNDANVEIFFIRKDDPNNEKGEQFSLAYKKYIPFYYIDAYRDLWREVNSSKGDLKQIFKDYNKHYLKPLDEQIIQVSKDISQYLEQYLEIENEEVISALNEIRKCLKSTDYNLEERRFNLQLYVSGLNEDMQKSDPADEILLNNILKSLTNIYHKIIIQITINKLQTNVNNIQDIKKIKEDVQENLALFIPHNDVCIELAKIDESVLFDESNVSMGDTSIFNQGSGSQGSFVIALKLSRLFSYLKYSEENVKSLVLGIEEPEAHMHPHLQRSFIKKLKRKQKELKDKGYSAQMLLTTHSPSILSQIDKSEITIIKKENGIYNPINLNNRFLEELEQEVSPRQIKHFDYIFRMYPEIFLSKNIIIVEGKTEFGAFPEFAKIIKDVDLDELGISIINAESKDAIKPLYLILKKITKCIAIRDNEGTNNDEYLIDDSQEPYYKTDYKDYEEEIVHSVDNLELVKILIEMDEDPNNKYLKLIKEYIPDSRSMKTEELLGQWNTLNFDPFIEGTSGRLENEITKSLKGQHKTTLSASIICSKMVEDDIPSCYKKILLKAKEMVVQNEG